MQDKRGISGPLIPWTAVTQAFICNFILTVWGGKGPRCSQSWCQFSPSPFPFISGIPARPILTIIGVFPLHNWHFSMAGAWQTLHSKHLVIDWVSGRRNPAVYHPSSVDAGDWWSSVCVSALQIFLRAVICFLFYITRNRWCISMRLCLVDQVTSKYTRHFPKVRRNWYDSLLEIPTFCFDKHRCKQKFLLLLMTQQKKKKKRKLNQKEKPKTHGFSCLFFLFPLGKRNLFL